MTLVEVISDGATVWVNGLDGAIGLFGKNGIDIHSADWDVFVEKMLEHHAVIVEQGHRPIWMT